MAAKQNTHKLTKKSGYNILLMHGPNLNLLGKREPQIYGKMTLDDIHQELEIICQKSGVVLECYQNNSEGALISKTHECIGGGYDFLIINPAGYTHTSIAWRDALLAVNTPFIEVHLSNIFAREEFRHKSYFSDIAVGIISGLGSTGYKLALNYAINSLLEKE
ncbi:MAG: 3-dehydroquinate dehydratase [Pseudomonadota bacterium]|nr:3-dehydroquinate dehydratase [Pseudomonadota bacterium]